MKTIVENKIRECDFNTECRTFQTFRTFDTPTLYRYAYRKKQEIDMILKKDVILTAKTHRYDIVLWTGLKKKMKTIVQKTKYINVILFGGQVSV